MSSVAESRPAKTQTKSDRLAQTRDARRVPPIAAFGLLLLWCLFLFFYGLGQGEFYRTECLRAIVAQQVLDSGNWLVPTLYGEPLFTKPPGMYAAIALASLPFGHVTEWSARLPSALAATITAFLMFGYFRRVLGPGGGLLAGLLAPVSLLWLDKATAADIDMLQVAWVSGAILCFLRVLEGAEDEPASQGTGRWSWWLAALACVAGGVLTKWTAPAFFYVSIVPLLWWRGRLRLLWCRKHLVSAALAASVCVAWAAAAVSLAGWDVFYTTVSQEALQRLAPSHHVHRLPWLGMVFHPLLVFAAALPVSALVPLTLRRGFSARFDARGRRLLEALHCWTWPNLLFWSLLPQHNIRYFFPLAPGLTGLAVLALYAWQHDRQLLRWFGLHPRVILIALLIGWVAVKLTYVHVIVPERLRGREPRAKGEALAAQVPADETLYLFRLKDEGIMFYYGRPARRLANPEQLTSRRQPTYCILDAGDWQNWPFKERTQPLLQLTDEQQAPILLVRLQPLERSP
ncbi:MAG TPA: glycosyltransferase family 39 protein [Gemmataceae bacterium]|nr:glycosyltransferase family 39 protein [Gemmataceae bacterium]